MRLCVLALVSLLAAAAAGGAPGAGGDVAAGSWTTFGNGPGRDGIASDALSPTTLRATFVLPLDGRITSQVLAARGVPAAGSTTLYATTSQGRVYAVSDAGYIRWTRDFGQLAHPCPQLDGYGLTGTPALDTATRTLYTADAFGRVHALDLATGAERPGWPVRVVGAFEREHVWGALLLAADHLYVPTGSYCDAGPMQGHVYAVDLATRNVESWAAVRAEDGGGGGIWGWGGVAYSAQRNSLFVATGNAFEGGTNIGPNFRETAGYGEHLVELSPTLEVRAASTTPEPPAGGDADLVGSPVVFERPGCGELVAAIRKDGSLFAWRTDDVAAGPVWNLQVEQYDPSNPVLSQLAYDPRLDALIVVTGKRIARIDVGADCNAHAAWSHALGTVTENGLPTIAGGTTWFGRSGKSSLVAVDDATGNIRLSLAVPGPLLTAPTILGGRLFVGSFEGWLHGFATAAATAGEAGPPTPVVPEHLSRASARLLWSSRADGVYSSDDGGRTWQRIYAQAAVSVVRASRSNGLIAVGAPPPACGCELRVLWTKDDGRTWHPTSAIGMHAVGSGRSLFWRDDQGAALFQVTHWPPGGGVIRSRAVFRAHGRRIVALASVSGGVAALLTARVAGHGWDETPQVVLYRNGRSSVRTLPREAGDVLVRSLSTTGPQLVVRGADFDSDGAIVPIVWKSRDRGRSWTHRTG